MNLLLAITLATQVASHNRAVEAPDSSPDAWNLFVRDAREEVLTRRPKLRGFWMGNPNVDLRLRMDREESAERLSDEAWAQGRAEDALRILYAGIIDQGTDITPLFDKYLFRLAQHGRWSEVRDIIAASRTSQVDGTTRVSFLALAMVESGRTSPGLSRYLHATLREDPEAAPLFDRLYPPKGGAEVARKLAWIEFASATSGFAGETNVWVVTRARELFPKDPMIIYARVDQITQMMADDRLSAKETENRKAEQIRLLKEVLPTLRPTDWLYDALWDLLQRIHPTSVSGFARPIRSRSTAPGAGG